MTDPSPPPLIIPSLSAFPPMTPAELKTFRKDELKATQTTAAAVLGVSLDTLRSWEQGKYPISGTAARLVAALRVLGGAMAQNRELRLELKVRDGIISELQNRLAPFEFPESSLR
jgi:DNA-binding XRE family transcriptional regulator